MPREKHPELRLTIRLTPFHRARLEALKLVLNDDGTQRTDSQIVREAIARMPVGSVSIGASHDGDKE